MPTIQFKGKNVIWNHHISVPSQTLDEVPKLDFQAKKGEGNLVIEGDNLLIIKLSRRIRKIKSSFTLPPVFLKKNIYQLIMSSLREFRIIYTKEVSRHEK